MIDEFKADKAVHRRRCNAGFFVEIKPGKTQSLGEIGCNMQIFLQTIVIFFVFG